MMKKLRRLLSMLLVLITITAIMLPTATAITTPETSYDAAPYESEPASAATTSSSPSVFSSTVGILPAHILDRYVVVQIGNDRAVVNGTDIHMIQPAFVESRTTFIPAGSISTLLGASPVTMTGDVLSITMGAQRFELTVGSLIVRVWQNGVRQPDFNLQEVLEDGWIAHPVRIVNNVVFAPLRAVSYLLGAQTVLWVNAEPGDVSDFVVVSMSEICHDAARTFRNIARPLLQPGYIGTTGVALTPSSLRLTIDRSLPAAQQYERGQFNASIQPANATNRTLSWTTSNPAVATVSASGVVTPVGIGTASITVRTADNTHIAANTQSRTVTVVERAHTVTLNTAPILNAQGSVQQHFDLTATVSPAHAENRTIFWSSSNTNVATVTQNGRVTAINAGTAMIRALVENSGGRVFVDRAVTVEARASNIVLNRNTLTLHMTGTYGESELLTTTVVPAAAVNAENIVWSSDNTNVATVDQSGNVTSTGVGTALIRATIHGRDIFPSIYAESVISVYNRATDISLNESFITLTIEGTQFGERSLTETILPLDAVNRDVTWETSDPNIAAVDQSGQVRAVNPGETTVRVRVDGTELYAETLVYVSRLPTGLTLDGSSWSLVVNNDNYRSVILTATPDVPAMSGAIIWSSYNPNVAAIDQNGVITAMGVGTTFVRAQLSGTDLFAIARIRVTEEVTGLALPSFETLVINGSSFQTRTLTPIKAPTTATAERLLWASSNENIVHVNQHGRVTAVNPGTAAITARTAEGGLEAHTLVAVQSRVTHVLLDQEELILTMHRGNIGSAQLGVTVLPQNATNTDVDFLHYDSRIIHVSQNGLVTARSGGRTEITVRARDNGIYSDTRVTVIVRADSLRLSHRHITLAPPNTAVGTTQQLRAIINPPNATNQDIVWASSNPLVATVDQSGLVSSAVPGRAVISAALDGLSDTTFVIVEPEIVIKSDFEHVFVNGNVMRNNWLGSFVDDGISMMSIRVLMDTLGNQSLNSYIRGTARIYTDDGLVVNLQLGRPTMYMRRATCTVAHRIHLPRSPRLVGGRLYVPARAVMEALGWNVHWTSRYDNVRGANYILLSRLNLTSGQVLNKISHARAPANLNIRRLTGIQLTQTEDIILTLDSSRSLSATLQPDVQNIESRFISWSSSNSSVVRVNQNTGQITAVNPGTATITATNGRGHSDSVSVRVRLHAPQNIRSESITHNSARLRWDPVSHAWGYRIEHGDGRFVAAVRTTYHNLTGLNANTQHTFRIIAQHAAQPNEATDSQARSVSFRTLVTPPTPPIGAIPPWYIRPEARPPAIRPPLVGRPSLEEQARVSNVPLLSGIPLHPTRITAPRRSFPSADDAARAWANHMHSTSLFTRHEHGAVIYRVSRGVYRLTRTVSGAPHQAVGMTALLSEVPPGATRVAGVHTHHFGPNFSGVRENPPTGDIGWAHGNNVDMYVSAPTSWGNRRSFHLRRYSVSRRTNVLLGSIYLRNLSLSEQVALATLYWQSWYDHLHSCDRNDCPVPGGWPTFPWPP